MATLADLMRDHDTDPAGTAVELRALVASGVSADEAPKFGWLINHVIGEKLDRWDEALALLRPICTDSAPAGAWRQLGVAASLAGDVLTAWDAEARIDNAQAGIAIRLSVLERKMEKLHPRQGALALRQCVALIDPAAAVSPITAMLAASLNNVVSALMDHEAADVSEPVLSDALTKGAALSRKLWGLAGTWVNQERADYLVAMVSNKVGKFAAARDAANEALQVIEANGTEDIDRAFILLELARAERGLGFDAAYKTAKDRALAIAAGFTETWLIEWFATRSAMA
jgi:hypothetical protein